MKKFLSIIFVFIILVGCDFISKPDRYISLPSDNKIIFNEGDTIIYRSNYDKFARYEILKIWNGELKISRGGTESKPPFDYLEFQAIYIDSIGNERSGHPFSEFYYFPSLIQDVGPFTYDECISIVKIAKYINVEVNWYKEMHRLGFQVDEIVDTRKILNRQFENVLIYRKDANVYNIDPISNEIIKDQIIIWYYTYQRGFIGFEYLNGEVFEIIN